MGSVGVLVEQGFGAHRFVPAGSSHGLWIAELYWPVPDSCGEADAAKYKGIEGDSGGDMAAHTLIDALLVAARLGDISSLFSVDTNAHDAGIYGIDMLQGVVAHLAFNGYTPASTSVAIVGNRLRIGTRRAKAEAALSAAVDCPVSVTATTTNHMGFTGRGEGIAAIANALAEKI